MTIAATEMGGVQGAQTNVSDLLYLNLNNKISSTPRHNIKSWIPQPQHRALRYPNCNCNHVKLFRTTQGRWHRKLFLSLAETPEIEHLLRLCLSDGEMRLKALV